MSLNDSSDILTVIVSFFTLDERIKCRRVSNCWKEAIYADHRFWEHMYCNYFKLNIFSRPEKVKPSNILNGGYWAEKLIGKSLELPFPADFHDFSRFGVETLDKVLEFKSAFCENEGESVFEESNHQQILDEDIREFEFRNDIPEIPYTEVNYYYLVCLIFDALTIGGYVPNIYLDTVKLSRGNEQECDVPILTLLSCFLSKDYSKMGDQLTSHYFNEQVNGQVQVGLNVRGGFVPVFSLSDTLTSAQYFFDASFDSSVYEWQNGVEYSQCWQIEEREFHSYYNAGGGWRDYVYVLFYCSCNIVTMERTFKRCYY